MILNAFIAAMFNSTACQCYRNVTSWSAESKVTMLRMFYASYINWAVVFRLFHLFFCNVPEKNWCESLLFNRVLIKEWFNISVVVAARSRLDVNLFRERNIFVSFFGNLLFSGISSDLSEKVEYLNLKKSVEIK